jgi:hypothetical protein
LTVQASSTIDARRILLAIAAVAALAISMTFAVSTGVRAGGENPCPSDDYACLNDAHVGTDSSETEDGEDCETGDVEEGEVLWHFILNQVDPPVQDGDPDFPLVLNAEFDGAGILTDEGEDAGDGGKTHHFFVFTTGDDILLGAWVSLPDGTTYGNLNLSHICHGDEVEETPTPTPTPEGGELGGTGTPTASVPDTSMNSSLGGPLATLVFGAVLLASLGALAYANVKSARNRA